MAEDYVPPISSKYFCIAGYREKALAAVVSSYLVAPGEYLPMFGFPSVTVGKKEDRYDPYDSNYLSTTRAEEFSIRVFNAMQRANGCEHLVLIGLTEEQKSFLGFLKDYSVIEISSFSDADSLLRKPSGKSEYHSSPKSAISQGLYNAIQQDKILVIDETASLSESKMNAGVGIVVAEDHDTIYSILAVNYAVSTKLNFKAIEPPELNRHELAAFLGDWKETLDDRHFYDLSALLYNRIETIEFNSVPFATFFTECAPYGLTLKNKILCTYVNVDLYPDFFIFNNIWSHHHPSAGAAVVFSPLEFKNQEETTYVINELRRQQYFVVPLVGKDATPYNLGHYIEEFPFELFHICSHGGEVSGTRIVEKFNDLDGNEHIIEYDEVVSFSPSPTTGSIGVTSKQIWRKLDGLTWRSRQLKQMNYQQSVFSEMVKKTHEKKKRTGVNIHSVEGSCAIKCNSFNYQATFHTIAGQTINPIVFNNTCWSWQGISSAFLASGCRGYIGTLWSVDNNVAVSFAESFYGNLFNDTVARALHTSMQVTDNTSDENIYAYWGLHFTKCSMEDSSEVVRFAVTKRLIHALKHWEQQSRELNGENWQIEEKKQWITRLLDEEFSHEWAILTLSDE